jgi:hypothetical protein
MISKGDLDGKVLNTWAIGRTSGAITITNGAFKSIGLSGSISVTSGNKLFISAQCGFYAAGTSHWSYDAFLNGTLLANSNWGDGINSGSYAVSGWQMDSHLYQHTLTSTGTYTIELKARCNVGSMQFGRDGTMGNGWGYDNAKMIIWEVTP